MQVHGGSSPLLGTTLFCEEGAVDSRRERLLARCRLVKNRFL